MKTHIIPILAASALLSGSLAYGEAGAGAAAKSSVAKFTYPTVSEKPSPAELISIPGPAGNQIPAVVRTPPGGGPFPAIVLLHGGLKPQSVEALTKDALSRPTHARFLAAGYVTITPTFRSREENPQTRAALEDCLAVIEHVKKMRAVDPRSVVVLGGSGGGSLALELAGETELCAVAAGEPATVLFTGMMTGGGEQSAALQEMMDEPKRFYTPKLQEFTRGKIARIGCPIFIGHGDRHAINKINHEIVIPELKTAGKALEVIAYPNQPHGFYFGGAGDPAAAEKFFDDANTFFQRHLLTQPTPVPESMIHRLPVSERVKRGGAGKKRPVAKE